VCTNLANLLLARGVARRPEIALRLSLGASRGRLVRQLATEGLLLAALGGVVAVAVAYFLHGVLVRMLAVSDARFQMSFRLDPLLLAFVLAVTLAAALLFGVLPALQATKTDAAAWLKELGRSTASARGPLRSGRILVSLQLALSLPLLVAAGLLLQTVHNLQRTDLGFPSEHLLMVRVDLQGAGYHALSGEGMLRNLLDAVKVIPGIQAVSFSQLGVFTGGESFARLRVEGHTSRGDHDRGSATDVVGPGYFAALGVPLLLGRAITESDRAGTPNVCVINEAFAKQFFARRIAIGKHITSLESENVGWTCEIVGVAKDARTQNLRSDIRPRFFTAGMQDVALAMSPTLLIRTTTNDAAVAPAVRKIIQGLDASVPILSVDSIEQQLTQLTAQDRATTQLVAIFGGVALALAGIGLYGVLSYGVARRTGEIAIRMALGAHPQRVIIMILHETTRLVFAGLVVGGGLACAATRLIKGRLYGVAPADPVTQVLASALLLLVALAASYLPAHRAARVDPGLALRHQ
jgi:predicted permease